MKNWIKAFGMGSVLLLLTNCVRDQTYIISHPATAIAGNTVQIKLLQRFCVILASKPNGTLDSEIVFTKLNFWAGNKAGSVPSNVRIYGYRMPQFKRQLLSKSDLDSIAGIIRLNPIPELMVGSRTLVADSVRVMDPTGGIFFTPKYDTLHNSGKDSAIAWTGFSGTILTTVKSGMDTITIPKGTVPDTLVTDNGAIWAVFFVGVEINFDLKVGPFVNGRLTTENYYTSEAMVKFGSGIERVAPGLDDRFGAWAYMSIKEPVSIEQRMAQNRAFMNYQGNKILFHWNEKTRFPIQIFNTSGSLIHQGEAIHGLYLLNREGLASGKYFMQVNTGENATAQQFLIK